MSDWSLPKRFKARAVLTLLVSWRAGLAEPAGSFCIWPEAKRVRKNTEPASAIAGGADGSCERALAHRNETSRIRTGPRTFWGFPSLSLQQSQLTGDGVPIDAGSAKRDGLCQSSS